MSEIYPRYLRYLWDISEIWLRYLRCVWNLYDTYYGWSDSYLDSVTEWVTDRMKTRDAYASKNIVISVVHSFECKDLRNFGILSHTNIRCWQRFYLSGIKEFRIFWLKCFSFKIFLFTCLIVLDNVSPHERPVR